MSNALFCSLLAMGITKPSLVHAKKESCLLPPQICTTLLREPFLRSFFLPVPHAYLADTAHASHTVYEWRPHLVFLKLFLCSASALGEPNKCSLPHVHVEGCMCCGARGWGGGEIRLPESNVLTCFPSQVGQHCWQLCCQCSLSVAVNPYCMLSLMHFMI